MKITVRGQEACLVRQARLDEGRGEHHLLVLLQRLHHGVSQLLLE
jgi:hypothetical protein